MILLLKVTQIFSKYFHNTIKNFFDGLNTLVILSPGGYFFSIKCAP